MKSSRKVIFPQQPEQESGVLTVELLLLHSLGFDLRGISGFKLLLQVSIETLCFSIAVASRFCGAAAIFTHLREIGVSFPGRVLQPIQPPQLRQPQQLPNQSTVRPVDTNSCKLSRLRRCQWLQPPLPNRRPPLHPTGAQVAILSVWQSAFDGRDLRVRNRRLRDGSVTRPVMKAFVVCARSAQGYRDRRRTSRRAGTLNIKPTGAARIRHHPATSIRFLQTSPTSDLPADRHHCRMRVALRGHSNGLRAASSRIAATYLRFRIWFLSCCSTGVRCGTRENASSTGCSLRPFTLR